MCIQTVDMTIHNYQSMPQNDKCLEINTNKVMETFRHRDIKYADTLPFNVTLGIQF